MKYLLSVLFFLNSYLSIAQNDNLVAIRSSFFKATQNSDDADLFFSKMEKYDESNAIILGYKAMADMMLSKHAYSPYTKIKYFNKGKEKLEKSIRMKPDNVELHYLRYATQFSVPDILKYNANLKDDKKIILNFLNSKPSDTDLERRIRDFLKHIEKVNS